MSYICRVGNLTGPPTLRKDSESGRPYCFARVAVNDRAKDDNGEWLNVGTTYYSLTVWGDQAARLVDLAESSGNVRILFTGHYRARQFNRSDGTQGTSHDVFCDEVAASLRGQQVRVPRGNAELDDTDTDAYWRALASS